METVVKPFKEVEIGDLGEDYGRNRGIVVRKGIGWKGKEELEKWDTSGYLSELFATPELFGIGRRQLNTLALVVVDIEELEKVVYIYGEGGFIVKEDLYLRNLKKIL